MLIQWFPGHMHKASREIKAIMEHIDLMIEILDARIPFSSQNPALAKLRGDKPYIKVLSKCDLADEQRTQQWQEYFEREQGVKTLAVAMSQVEKNKTITCIKTIKITIPTKRVLSKNFLKILNSSLIFLAFKKLKICNQTKVLKIKVKCLDGPNSSSTPS